MWHKTLTRQQFVEAVGNLDRYQPLPFSPEFGEPEPPEGDKLTAIWLSEAQPEKALPDILLIASQRITEFIAFSATFVGSIRPLSAHIRLLTPEQYFAARRRDREHFRRVGLEAFVGAVIAEALTEIRSKRSFDALSMNAFTSTFSFAMGRNLWLYRDEVLFEDTSRFWFGTREWTRQPMRRLQKQQLMQIWTILKNFSEGKMSDHVIVDALIDLYEHKSLGAAVLKALTHDKMSSEDLKIIMSSPREERLKFVENYLVSDRTEKNIIDDFLCGYFMSLISNGTMDYASLLVENLDKFPTGLMWYGICGGVQREGRLDSWKRGLQHWITREIRRDFCLEQRPTADVSAIEFQVLLRAPSKGGLLQHNSRTLAVELVPGVEQSLPWPPKAEEAKPPEQNVNDSNKALTIEDVNVISQKCQAILKRFEASQNLSEPTQLNLEIQTPVQTDRSKKDRNKRKSKR